MSGKTYKAVRITGPQHNFLGLDFGEINEFEVVKLPAQKGTTNLISPNDVLRQVTEGLAEANQALGSQYRISKVYFVPSDTLSESVYKILTIELIKRIEDKGSFVIL